MSETTLLSASTADNISAIRICDSRNGVRQGTELARLTAIGPPFMVKRTAIVVCECKCGTITAVRAPDWKAGSVTSCGCYKREMDPQRVKTHGLGKSRLYSIWKNIKTRCTNQNVAAFRDYGGRGVRICDEWSDFQAFYDWAMANGYGDDLTIDRRENDGNYEPSNCRWITKSENTRERNLRYWKNWRNR